MEFTFQVEGQRKNKVEEERTPTSFPLQPFPGSSYTTPLNLPSSQNVGTRSHLGARGDGKCCLYLDKCKNLFYSERTEE